MRESVHRPAGRCDKVYKREKRIHAGRMRFARFRNTATTIEAFTSPLGRSLSG